jgi:hypothetical protein
MASVRFKEATCDLCGCSSWKDEMIERTEGFCCVNCSELPPYSDDLYTALVLIQRAVKKYLAARTKPCFNCETMTFHLYSYHGGEVCGDCYDDLREHERRDECPGCGHEACCCEDDDGWCEKCEGAHGCVCAEQEEDARLARHRRICGFPDCEGGCGTLDCGCIDKCKCDGWWVGLDGGWGDE